MPKPVSSHLQKRMAPGFSLVEALLAVSIVTVAGLGLSWTMAELHKNRMKVEYITDVSALEGALTEAMIAPSTYQSQVVKSALSAGKVPAGITLQLQGTAAGSAFNLAVTPGQTIMLDNKFLSCVGFPSATCSFQIKTQLKSVGGRMAYAYSVAANNPDLHLNYYGAGSPPNSLFPDAEFKVPIPFEDYLSQLLLMCNPATSIGVSGLDRLHGIVSCVQQPNMTSACASGTLPKGLRLIQPPPNPTGPADPSVAFTCSGAVQGVTCPVNYSLFSLNTTTLDNGAKKAGQCVYSLAKNAQGPALKAQHVSGRVCPAGYTSVSTCNVVTVKSSNGTCSPWCKASKENCAAATVVNNPDGSGTQTVPWTCTDNSALIVAPTPGSAVFKQNIAGGLAADGMVDCQLAVPARQPCGGNWTGEVVVNVQCQLTAPELVNVQ